MRPSFAVAIATALTASVSAAILTGCSAKPTPQRADSWHEALERARALQRPILIDISTDGCPPCEAFHRATVNDRTVRESLTHVVLVSSTPRGAPDLESLRATARSYPTFVLFDQQGSEVDRWVGFGRTANWCDRLAGALVLETPLETVRAQHRQQPTAATARRLARLATDANDPEAAVRYLDEASQLSEDKPPELWRDRVAALLTLLATRRTDSTLINPRVAAAVEDARQACAGDASCQLSLVELVQNGWYRAEPLESRLGAMLADIPEQADQELERRRITQLAQFAWVFRHDEATALGYWHQHLALHRPPDPDSTLAFAAWVFDARAGFDALERVSAAALEGVRDPALQAPLLDVLAEARFNQGRLAEAIDTMDRAARLDPDHPRHADTRDAWRELLAKSPRS